MLHSLNSPSFRGQMFYAAGYFLPSARCPSVPLLGARVDSDYFWTFYPARDDRLVEVRFIG